MLTKKLKQLINARNEARKLERKLAADLNAQLLQLSNKYGFKDINAFVKTLTTAANSAQEPEMPRPARNRRDARGPLASFWSALDARAKHTLTNN